MINDQISQVASRNEYEHYRKNYVEVFGLIVKNDDPLFQGRIKAKIFGYNENIPIDETSWISPNYTAVFAGNNGGGVFSYPKLGHVVKISGPDQYHLEYTVIIELNEGMVEMLKKSYINTQVLTYDEDEELFVLYTKGEAGPNHEGGMLISLKDSFFHISEETGNVLTYHKSGNSLHHLKSNTIHAYASELHLIETNTSLIDAPDLHQVDSWKVRLGYFADNEKMAFSATKCEILMQLFKGLATIIDAKSFPPGVPAAMTLVNTMGKLICSKTVSIGF